MARPRIEIDEKAFTRLCEMQCTEEEIAGFFACSVDTIERWCKRTYRESFAEVFAKKRSNGRIALRRWQYRMAETVPTMAIWLGKQYLGQREQQEITVNHDEESVREMHEYINQKTGSGHNL